MNNSVEDFFEEEKIEDGKSYLTSKNIDYTIEELANNEWKSFALYTVESRAIPSLVDGLKPSQRFYLYSTIQSAKTNFEKVSAIGGTVSKYGYQHGEASVCGAGQLMAADWNNNVCIVEGRGAFGSRLVQSAAAARYTYTKLHSNFSKFFKDEDLAPKHEDPEHLPPRFYLPIIPLVLANGVKGIATGFATDILPRDPDDLKKACIEYIKTNKITKKPSIKFPKFSGEIEYDKVNNKYIAYGIYNKKSATILEISEVPPSFDRESYIKILDDLEDNDKIVGYDDLCDGSGFRFNIKLKKNVSAEWDHDQIIKEFKLSKSMTENITVVDQFNKLKVYKDECDLIKDFCDYKKTIIKSRIDKRLEELSEDFRWLTVKSEFITEILNEKIIFKNKSKDEVSKLILKYTSALERDTDRLLRINIMSLTSEMVKELEELIKDISSKIDFWKKTTIKDQFLSDLSEI
jgi:DNA gyrase/topoisomerase IV subunit A